MNEADKNTGKGNGVVVDGSLQNGVARSDRVMPMALNTLSNAPAVKPSPPPRSGGRLPLEAMADVPITLVFEVGRTNITIKQLMELCEGSYVDLHDMSVDSIDVRIDGKIIAQAETIALVHRYGIRFGEVEMYLGYEKGKHHG